MVYFPAVLLFWDGRQTSRADPGKPCNLLPNGVEKITLQMGNEQGIPEKS